MYIMSQLPRARMRNVRLLSSYTGDVDVVVNFLSQVIFCFSFVFGYGNVANEAETTEK